MCKENKSISEKIDWFFNKLLPKKFLVVTIATVLVFVDKNVPEPYWYILMAYFGVNVIGKFAKGVEK